MSDLLYNPPKIKKKAVFPLFQLKEGSFALPPVDLRSIGDHLYFLVEKEEALTTQGTTLVSMEKYQRPTLALYRALDPGRFASWLLAAEMDRDQELDLGRESLIWQKGSGEIVLKRGGRNYFAAKEDVFSSPRGEILSFYIADKEIYLLNKRKRSKGGQVYRLQGKMWVEVKSHSSEEGFIYKRRGASSLLVYPEGLASLSPRGLSDIYVSPLIPEDVSLGATAPGPKAGEFFFLEEGHLFYVDIPENKKEVIHKEDTPESSLVSHGDLLALFDGQAVSVFRKKRHLFSFRAAKDFSAVSFIPEGLILWQPGERFYQKITFSLR